MRNNNLPSTGRFRGLFGAVMCERQTLTAHRCTRMFADRSRRCTRSGCSIAICGNRPNGRAMQLAQKTQCQADEVDHGKRVCTQHSQIDLFWIPTF
jgi:hypothetical protein